MGDEKILRSLPWMIYDDVGKQFFGEAVFLGLVTESVGSPCL